MKSLVSCLYLGSLLLCFSCQKDPGPIGTLAIAKVQVIQGVMGAENSAKVNVFDREADWTKIPDAKALPTSGPKLDKLFYVSTLNPTFLQISPMSDLSKFWMNETKNLQAGKVYTLYVSGMPRCRDIASSGG